MSKANNVFEPYEDLGFVQELLRLVMREIEMHDMGRPKSSFTGLRQRIKTLFYAFIVDPDCNPAYLVTEN